MSEPIPVPISGYDLSTIINKTPENGIIEVPAGTFPVRCDGTVILKAGVTIRGASKSATIIQRDTAFPINNQPVLLGQGDGITVENLTLDANAPESPISDYAYACLRIIGKRARIVNVDGLRPSGNWQLSNECWPFFIVNDDEYYPTSIISDCSVSYVRGNYVEGFSSTGAAVFRNCRVEHRLVTDDSCFFNGFQAAGRSMLINCVVNGGTGFFYTDTSSVSCIFRGCLGLNIMSGIIVNVKPGQVSDGLTVDGCEFQLTPNLPRSRWGVAISGPEGSIRNVRMLNSVVRWTPTSDAIPATDLQKCAVAVTGGYGTIIQNNAVDSDFGFSHEIGAVVNGNTAIARAPIAPIP